MPRPDALLARRALALPLFALLALALAPAARAAEPLPPPRGAVVLTVSGKISVRNAPETAVFDLALLQSLGTVTIRTTTIWTTGEQQFTGVPLMAVLQRLGASGHTIEAAALNDYFTEIPVSDAESDPGPIIAYAQNGELLSVRDKGPLWIVYPYDADAALRSEVIYARSIWQLVSLQVKD